MALAALELGRIVQANQPVLCVDTCSVLDVLRDPSRETSLPHDAVAAMAMLRAMESGPRLISVLADQVRVELGNHLADVEAAALRGLQKLRAHVARTEADLRCGKGWFSVIGEAFCDHAQCVNMDHADHFERYQRVTEKATQ